MRVGRGGSASSGFIAQLMARGVTPVGLFHFPLAPASPSLNDGAHRQRDGVLRLSFGSDKVEFVGRRNCTAAGWPMAFCVFRMGWVGVGALVQSGGNHKWKIFKQKSFFFSGCCSQVGEFTVGPSPPYDEFCVSCRTHLVMGWGRTVSSCSIFYSPHPAPCGHQHNHFSRSQQPLQDPE